MSESLSPSRENFDLLGRAISIIKGKKPSVIYLAPINDRTHPYILIENFGRFYRQYTDDLSCKLAYEDDVLIVWDGERAGLTSHGHSGYIGSTLAAVRITDKSLDSKYLLYVLEKEQTRLRNSSEGTGVPHLSRWAVENISYFKPQNLEQKKIAAVLSSVDEVIEKTRAQIDKLKDLKTGMMQELLTHGIGHTEFKDSPVGRIPRGWATVSLAQVIKKIDSGWSPLCSNEAPLTGGWGVLKVSAVTRGVFLEQEAKALPVDLEPREHALVHKGDILLTRANGVAELVGKCVMVRKQPKSKLMLSDKILRLTPSEEITNEFLLYIFNSQMIRAQIELSWGGSSGQKNISQAGIRSYLIPLPSIGEQKIIAKSIFSVDASITTKIEEYRKLKRLKKALMQDLLTGKVRVKLDQPETTAA